VLLNPNQLKICLISDTHEEHKWRSHPLGSVYDKLLEEDEFDILVAAGDIDSSTLGATKLLEKYENKPILYLAGNHEFYYNSLNILNTKFRKLAEEHENFIFFEDGQHFHYEGIDFIGGTNWPAIPKSFQLEVKYNIADYNYILHHKVDDWSLKETFDNNIRGLLEGNKYNKLVGLSHFLPCWEVVDPKWMHPMYKNLNNYFVSPIPPELLQRFDYWLFGHTHDQTQVNHLNCKMIANPRGYPHENQVPWEPLLLNINI